VRFTGICLRSPGICNGFVIKKDSFDGKSEIGDYPVAGRTDLSQDMVEC